MSKIKIFSLGGLNENGKNMYVVEVDQDIFVFDAGLKYADEKMLGIDYILPKYDYLKENVNRIQGIFLTHGHDENIGALPDMLKEVPNLKIYGTSFTIALLRKELEEEKIKCDNLIELLPHRKIKFGQCSVFPISVTHSIPGSVAYVLYTPDGNIVYTGDFVFDPTMTGPYKTDIGKLAYVGKQGVLCLLSESVYADKPGHTSPHHRISSVIREIFTRSEDRLIFSVYAAHLYRIQELFNEIAKTDRKVVIMGKRLQGIITMAMEKKYITINKNKIGDLSNINDKNVVILISNNREKPFSNLEKIVNGYDHYIKLKETDTIMFGEPVAEGLEKTEAKICDEISKIGANVITLSPKKYLEHHASSEDLMLMLNLMNPTYYMPVKGQYRHQFANANCASQIGYQKDRILLKQNGDVVLFDRGKLKETTEKIPVDSILIDGNTTKDIGDLVLKDRAMLSENGIVIVSTTVNRRTKEIIAGPEIFTRGFIYVKENPEIIKESQELCLEVIKANITNGFVDFNKIKMGVRDKLDKFLYKKTGCKPMIITVLHEVNL